jgi:uncharacterized protein YfdQ (DUF2303 family)
VFNKEAIQEIMRAAAISQAADALNQVARHEAPVVALPSDFQVHDMERFQGTRRRARGNMETPALSDFAKYVEEHQESGAAVFVNIGAMTATAVLNLGLPHAPGHADNRALYAPPQLAAYKAMGAIGGRASTQQDVAEFLEDWPGHWQAVHESEPMTIPATIAAVRNITIEAMKKADATVSQLSSSQSAFEQVKASSGGSKLPTHIHFKCEPFLGFEPRTFVMRLAIRASDKAPAIVLRVVNIEQHMEEMGQELATKVRAIMGALPVHLGTYQPK